MLTMGLLSHAQPANIPQGEAVVVRVIGTDAVVARSEGQILLQRGAIITEGDQVITNNSRVLIAFSNGTTSTIYANTLITFETLRQDSIPEDVKERFGALERNPSLSVTKLYLSEGEILSNVKKLKDVAPESTFEIATKVGTAGIRGTLLKVTSKTTITEKGEKIEMKVDVLEGNAEIKTQANAASNSNRNLDSGKEIVIKVETSKKDDDTVETDEEITEGYISSDDAENMVDDTEQMNTEAKDLAEGNTEDTNASGQKTSSDKKSTVSSSEKDVIEVIQQEIDIPSPTGED